jgi:hypothetical protein
MLSPLPRRLAPHLLARLVFVVLAFSACAAFPGEMLSCGWQMLALSHMGCGANYEFSPIGVGRRLL